MSKIFLESLDTNRQKVFSKIKEFRNFGVLGGGTALALQINHRISYDFDIFVNKKIDKNMWKKSKDVFGKDSNKYLDTEDQLNLYTPEGISVTFFLDDYSLLFEPIKTEIIDLMNIKDIAVNKAFIIGKRPKWRDYVDLYFILKNKYLNIEELIDLSIRKFKTDFSQKLFLEQFVYWDDVKDYEVQYAEREIDPDEIKEFLINEVKNYKNKVLH